MNSAESIYRIDRTCVSGMWKIRVCSHPVGVSAHWSHHGDEERLLQQSDHSADHGLEACQGAKVVGRVTVGEILGGYQEFERQK